MKTYAKFAVLTVSLMFFGVALWASGASSAQPLMPGSDNRAVVLPTPPPATPTPAVDDEVLKIDTELVNILFTAQDRDRRLLTNLKQEDVRILEDGQPQEIFTFQRQTDLPLSISILIDTSVSQERTLPYLKEAAKSFIEAVVRPEKDEVSVLSFTGETTLEQDLTGNIARLRRAVDRVRYVPPAGTASGVLIGTPPISGGNQRAAGSTAIWDAVWVTSNEVLGRAPERTRRAIILLTDGINTYGSKKLEDAVQEAIRNDAIIYCVGIGDQYYGGIDEGALKKIAERTGGRAFIPRDDEGELRQAFSQIQTEMRSQYLLAYEPTNQKRDGSYRKIEIQLANPDLGKQKVKLTYKQGYFSKNDAEKK
jgi:VWFA-related protein